jgi:hypothetical protein
MGWEGEPEPPAAHPTLRRSVAVLVAVLVAVSLVGLGRLSANARWCRHGGVGGSPRSALDDYQRWCLDRPHVSGGPYDAGYGANGYQGWYEVREFAVQYGRTTRFVLVGHRTTGDAWHVITEGTGP